MHAVYMFMLPTVFQTLCLMLSAGVLTRIVKVDSCKDGPTRISILLAIALSLFQRFFSELKNILYNDLFMCCIGLYLSSNYISILS